MTATLRIFENGRLQVVIRMESRLPEARARKSEKKKSAAPLSAQHLDHILNKERTLAVKETEGSGNGFENFRGGDVLLNPDIIEKRQVALRDVLAGDRWLIGDPNSGEVFWRLPVRGKWKQKSATAEILEYELKDSWKDRSYRLTVRLAAGNPPEPFQVADVKLSMHEGEAALFSIVLEDISSNPL